MTYDPIKQGIAAAPYDDERDRREMQKVNSVSRRLGITVFQARQLIESHGAAVDYLRHARNCEQADSLVHRIDTDPKGTDRLIADALAGGPLTAEPADNDADGGPAKAPILLEAATYLLLSAMATAAIYWLWS